MRVAVSKLLRAGSIVNARLTFCLWIQCEPYRFEFQCRLQSKWSSSFIFQKQLTLTPLAPLAPFTPVTLGTANLRERISGSCPYLAKLLAATMDGKSAVFSSDRQCVLLNNGSASVRIRPSTKACTCRCLHQSEK